MNKPQLLDEIKSLYAASVVILSDDEEEKEMHESYYPVLKFLNRDDKTNLYLKF